MQDIHGIIGQNRSGVERTGQDRSGQDRTGQDRTGQDRTGQDRTGQDRTGQDRTGQDRTGQDRTGQFKYLSNAPRNPVWTSMLLGSEFPAPDIPIASSLVAAVVERGSGRERAGAGSEEGGGSRDMRTAAFALKLSRVEVFDSATFLK
jgi:hypothetical protein